MRPSHELTNGRSADASGTFARAGNTVSRLMPPMVICCTTSLRRMDQSLGPDAASECVLVRVARFCKGGRILLCQRAGDQAAQEVADHKASCATIGLAERDDTPKSKGWHNVVWDAGTRKL